MNFRWLFFVLALSSGMLVNRLQADMLWLIDSETPVSGTVVSQSADAIEYRYQVDGVERTVQVKRTEIRELVVTIDQEALELLSPNDLRSYLDQAEQLAANRPDSYAIQTAKRLCLIVARWGQPDLKESAFRLLISICEGEELARVQRLAYVYQPAFEFSGTPQDQVNETSKRERDTVVEIIRLVCREQSAEAKRRLEDEQVSGSVRQTLNTFSSVCSYEELLAAVDAELMSLSQLGRLLRLERALESNQVPSSSRRAGFGKNWFAASEQIDASGSVLPEFDNVLPFDSSLTIYRDGKWIAPEKN